MAHVPQVSVGNIKHLIEEIFYENIVRGRGLFCRSAMRAQSSSTTFTNVYAAMIAIINTKMPELGNLVIRRLVLNFKKAFNRNDRAGESHRHAHDRHRVVDVIVQVAPAASSSSVTCSISRW
jgi:hypothetical protein